MNDRRSIALPLSAFLVVAGLMSCADATRPAMPTGSASFAGRIVSRDAGSLLLEAASAQPAGGDRASVHLHAGTRVFLAGGARVEHDALQPGQRVRAWFDGPVMESYPVQATAGAIVIDDRSR